MRDLTGRQETIKVPGKTVGQVIAALDAAYPGIRDRVCEGDRIGPAVAVSVDGRIAQLELFESVGEQSEIRFLPALSGG